MKYTEMNEKLEQALESLGKLVYHSRDMTRKDKNALRVAITNLLSIVRDHNDQEAVDEYRELIREYLN